MHYVFLYLIALLYFRTNGTCASLARAVGKLSHDSLTRFLKKDFSGQKLLEAFREPLPLSGGYLIIDTLEILHPHAKKLEGLSWVYSSIYSKVVFGYQLVLLIWTDGVKRIPIGLRIYQPGGPTKIQLALELLSYARNTLRLRPDYVIFDSWFAARVLLKRIKDYGWYFITRFKKNRKFNGSQLQNYRSIPYWHQRGFISGGLRVLVVKHRNKYYATNRLSLTREEVMSLYKIRQQIEETIRQLKQECSINGCQVNSLKAQEHHFFLSLCTFCLLEKERLRRNISLYLLRELLISRRVSISILRINLDRAFA